jgi:hypothetical protein
MATMDRKPYESATVLDQDFLDDCHDNLVNQLELIVDIETPTGTIHLSDRNKYVGSTFYEARLNFPVINRTVGEFLSPTLEFSQLQLEINNADGIFNDILPAGDDYDGWIGRQISVSLGLRDVASTYKEIFRGRVTDQGGFQRTVKSFTLVARNDFEKINVDFPKSVFKATSFPFIEAEVENTIVPVIYGDWTVEVQPDGASVPAYVVNGADPDVDGSTSFSTEIECVISENDNTFFDDTEVYLFRNQTYYPMDAGDITGIVGNRAFQIRQSGTTPAGTTTIDGVPFEFTAGDKFFVKVQGKDLGSGGAYDDNIIWQARDILMTYAGMVSGDFDSNWIYYRDKSSPSESAVASILSRVWVQEPQPTLSYALSMLEQVRLEAFIDRNLKLKINSLHLDDFEPSPTFPIKNWDVEAGTFVPKLDDRNNFNRARGSFNFLPNRNENFQETPIFKNAAAISQVGKEISKRIVFPNLYTETDVENQVKELLRIASAYIEVIETTLTWRSMLLDIGDFVKINVSIQGTQFVDVPAMIREIGYDPAGIKIPVKMWSFQLMPFPGHSPSFSGITGGSTATITQE